MRTDTSGLLIICCLEFCCHLPNFIHSYGSHLGSYHNYPLHLAFTDAVLTGICSLLVILPIKQVISEIEKYVEGWEQAACRLKKCHVKEVIK